MSKFTWSIEYSRENCLKVNSILHVTDMCDWYVKSHGQMIYWVMFLIFAKFWFWMHLRYVC